MTDQQGVIRAAMAVAKDAAEGRLDPTAVDAELTERCRQLFAVVVGPGDPLWPVQVDVARQVLATSGVPADELHEWSAVARHRAQGGETAAPGMDMPADPESAVSGPHSPDLPTTDERKSPT